MIPFELHPEVPPEGADIASHLGMPPARLEQMQEYLRGRMAEFGLPYIANRRWIFNTHKALLLSEWAREKAPAQELVLNHHLFRAYFADESNLADEAILRDVMVKVGLPADAALAQMDAPSYEKRLAEYGEMAKSFGITGVPAFIINGRYKIVGAQPYDTMLEALRQIAGETS